MKKCKIMYLYVMILFLATSVFARNVYEPEEEWFLAATEFTFDENTENAELLSEIAQVLPQLILTEFDSSPERLIEAKEMSEKVDYYFNLEQNELYDTLSSQIETRDKALFSVSEADAQRKLRSQVSAYNKEIEETKETLTELQDNRLEERKIVLNNESYYCPVVLWGEQTDLYNNSAENPFDDSISAIISGEIEARAEYISVNTQLTLYPSREVVFQFSDAGTVQDVSAIAQSIAKHLFPAILNSKTSNIIVSIEPKEAASNALLEINGIDYDPDELIELPAGEHSFYIQSDGYESARLLYTIESEESYTVKAVLNALEPVDIAFFSEEIEGSLFLNAVPQGDLPSTLSIENESFLGEFSALDNNSTFFYLNAQDIKETSLATLSVTIVPNQKDLGNEIERRRKGMYTAYGALLISLPLTYLALGTYVNAHNNYALGYDSESELLKWQQVYDISSGVSIGCGIIFAVQLARYLWAANKVIPQQITPNSIKIEY